MTEQALANRNDVAALAEKVVMHGDLAELTPADRMAYYSRVCDTLGLNPLTQPFAYIRLNNKLTLYAKRDATDQLRRIHGVSIAITGRESVNGVYVVTARATSKDGRTDEAIGAVALENLKGDALANAYMKAETKAKRRVTLSVVGLGWLDETEVETVPSAQPVAVDTATGELQEPAEARDTRPITEPQRRRLFAISREAGVNDADVKAVMWDVAQVEQSKDIPAWAYDTIVELVQEIGKYEQDHQAGRAADAPGEE